MYEAICWTYLERWENHHVSGAKECNPAKEHVEKYNASILDMDEVLITIVILVWNEWRRMGTIDFTLASWSDLSKKHQQSKVAQSAT